MWFKNNFHSEVTDGIKTVYPRLWRYCLTLTGKRDRADDLAQMACVRAIEKAHLFEPGTRLDLWLFRLTQRVWLNEIRADTVRQIGNMLPIEGIEIPDNKPNPETNLLAQEVLHLVMGLPEAQRAAVILVYVEGFSYLEASTILNIPIGTVMSRLAAARFKVTRVSNQSESVKK